MPPSTLGLPVSHPFRGEPAERRRRRAEVGGHEGAGGQPEGGQRAAGVEAEPAHPEQAGADEAQHQVVRLHGRRADSPAACPGTSAQTSAETPEVMCTTVPPAKSKHGNLAAREGVQQPALAPHHVRHREVDEQRPEHREQQHGAELHALGERAARSAPA